MEQKKGAKSKGREPEKLDFEKALKELEKIAQALESGDMGLEESIKSFEKGMKLARFCHRTLEEAEKKIELLQKGGDGEAAAREVGVKRDTGEIEEDEEMQGSLL